MVQIDVPVCGQEVDDVVLVALAGLRGRVVEDASHGACVDHSQRHIHEEAIDLKIKKERCQYF